MPTTSRLLLMAQAKNKYLAPVIAGPQLPGGLCEAAKRAHWPALAIASCALHGLEHFPVHCTLSQGSVSGALPQNATSTEHAADGRLGAQAGYTTGLPASHSMHLLVGADRHESLHGTTS